LEALSLTALVKKKTHLNTNELGVELQQSVLQSLTALNNVHFCDCP